MSAYATLTYWIAAQFDDVIYQLSCWFEKYLHYAATDIYAAEAAVRSAVDVRVFWQSMPDLFSIIYSRRYIDPSLPFPGDHSTNKCQESSC